MREQEKNKFKQLGIPIGSSFEIMELNGLYKVDIDDGVVIDMTPGRKGAKLVSIYNHLLDGTWHKRK